MRSTTASKQALYGAAYHQGILSANRNSDDGEHVGEVERGNPRPIEVSSDFLDTMEKAIRRKGYERLEEAADR